MRSSPPPGGPVEWPEIQRRLRSGMRKPRPGPSAQERLAPRPRIGWRPGEWPADSRVGAGLVLLYPRSASARLLLTRRHGGLAQHAGQVSFPGGAVEPGESPTQAALREAEEEVGVAPSLVRVLGELSPLHIPVSAFVLHSVLATSEERPALRPDRDEVERILEVPLADLIDPARLRVEASVPYFAVEGERVWGATAMVLAELLTLLGHRPRCCTGSA